MAIWRVVDSAGTAGAGSRRLEFKNDGECPAENLRLLKRGSGASAASRSSTTALQAVVEVIDLLLRLVPGDAAALLHASCEVFAAAFAALQIVVGQLSSLLLQGADG